MEDFFLDAPPAEEAAEEPAPAGEEEPAPSEAEGAAGGVEAGAIEPAVQGGATRRWFLHVPVTAGGVWLWHAGIPVMEVVRNNQPAQVEAVVEEPAPADPAVEENLVVEEAVDQPGASLLDEVLLEPAPAEEAATEPGASLLDEVLLEPAPAEEEAVLEEVEEPIVEEADLLEEEPPLEEEEAPAGQVGGGCVDSTPDCVYWGSQGDCERNPFWMQLNCQKTCNSCGKRMEDINAPPPVEG